jgi:hypothetical protein
MADEEEDPGESWSPEDDELSEQEKLKLELQKLNAAQTSIAPARVQLTPEQIAAHNKNQPGYDTTPKVIKTEKITPTSPDDKPVEAQAPPEPVDAPITMDPDTPELPQNALYRE